jgi:hypothetical protein
LTGSSFLGNIKIAVGERRETVDGKIAIEMAKVHSKERLDGKYQLPTSDNSLSPEVVAFGYRQLLQIEWAFRTFKTTLDLRPVHYRKKRSDLLPRFVQLAALLLMQVVERETGKAWDTIRTKMEMVNLGEFFGKDRSVL